MADLNRAGIMPAIQALTRDTHAFLFTGAHRSDPLDVASFNSSYLFDPAGEIVAQYDKIHLAPFGEYVPLGQLLPFIEKVVPAIGDIDSGDTQATLAAGPKTLGPLICFEVLFAPMAESLRAAGADVLVVITNLAWFGSSNAIPQELEIARLRAIETRLPLIHSANTGVSGVFDPWGRFDDVDLYVGAGGPVNRPDLPQSAKTMQRFAGRFAIAAPGDRLIPGGPVYVPYAAMLLAALLLGAGLWRRFGPAPLTPSDS
jgi:apolipoprotein N-acyltransferase